MLKNEEIISDEVEVTNTLNTFVSNTIKNFEIPEKFADHYFTHSLSRHPTLNAILKYKGQQAYVSLKEFLNVFQVFIFHQLTKILFLKK